MSVKSNVHIPNPNPDTDLNNKTENDFVQRLLELLGFSCQSITGHSSISVIRMILTFLNSGLYESESSFIFQYNHGTDEVTSY